MAEFDLKQVTPLEWAGIGGGALAFIASFFPWLSASTDLDLPGGSLGSLGSASAWNSGFLAWFSVLLLVGAAVVVLLPKLGTAVPNQSMIWLGLSGAAVVFIVLRWVTSYESAFGFSVGAGFGLFVGLLAALASAAGAFLTFRSAKSATPNAGPAAYPPAG